MDQHITWREGAPVTAEQAIAEYVRVATVSRVAEMRAEAAALLARAADLEKNTAAQEFWCWPFSDALEAGVYMARGGTWLGSCERAAQHLATATGRTVRYSHNDRIREVTPGPKAAAE